MFVILDKMGRPLCDLHGNLIRVASEAVARSFLLPGERVRPYDPTSDEIKRERI